MTTRPTTRHVPGIEQVRDAWNVIAGGFDEFVTPETIVLGKEVVRRLGLRPGTRLLDVAAGSGALSIPAARIGVDVVATDLAPAMIERLDARARAEGLPALRGRVMDGHALDLDDDAFDVAASVNGVSLFHDMARGLSELVRVTRPGGRVVIVAFGPVEKVEFVVFAASAVRAAVPGVTPPPPLPFPAADADVLRERLAGAALREVRIDTIGWEVAFDSGRHLWHVFAASTPVNARMVTELTVEQQAEVTDILEGMLRERSAGAPGAVLRSEINIGIGTV